MFYIVVVKSILYVLVDGSKMDTGEGSKSSKKSSSEQDIQNSGDIGEDINSRDLVVDDLDDDDKLTDDGIEEGGRVRVVREQERRYANNARERYRVIHILPFISLTKGGYRSFRHKVVPIQVCSVEL